jgi:hypothetical protein
MRALSASLVLLADHELAASTLAARVAASVRADPYAVVGTGLGAMSGALHGGASLGAETLLAAAADPSDVPRVVGELLRRGEKVPGFGHFVYRAGDPRAILLLDLVRRAAPKSGPLAVAEAVLAEVRQKSLPEPNIDLAIATLARVAGMTRGSGEAIFAVARAAGWIAHALEAYAGPGPLRPRAVYTGPRLLARDAVGALAQQVGVAEVAGVLLDHVQVDQAQRHDLAPVHERVVERGVGRRRVGQLDLLGQPGVVGGGPARVEALEVGVGLGPEGVIDRLAREPLAEPGPLDLRHVPHQPEQGEARRRHGALG